MNAFSRALAGLLLVPLVCLLGPTPSFALRAGLEGKEPEVATALGHASSTPAAAGAEELRRTAAFIRTHGLVDVAREAGDAEVVRAYLGKLWPQLESEIPQGLSVTVPYHAGPLWGAPEAPVWETYPQVELFPGLDKVLGAVAEQLGAPKDRLEAYVEETLHDGDLKAFYRALFNARDADGYLVRGRLSEITVYQLAYRPDILGPLLHAVADRTVDRTKLQQALANPFRGTNDSGNAAMVQTIAAFLNNANSGFTDDPEMLGQDHDRLIPWIRLMLAANLADATRPKVWDEIQGTGNLSDYFKEWLRTPFLKALHGEQDVRAFIARVLDPNHALLFFPDNNLELAADLKMAEVLLSASPTLRILFVPKRDNGVMNDASVQDTERLLNPTGPAIYARLRQYAQQTPPRFTVLQGPAVQGLPLHLMPDDVVKAVNEADSILAIGEANTYTLNGLHHEYIYLGLRLKWWEVVGERVFKLSKAELANEGLTTADRPPVFVRADGSKGPYYQADLSGELFSTIRSGLVEPAAAGAEEVVYRTGDHEIAPFEIAPTGITPTPWSEWATRKDLAVDDLNSLLGDGRVESYELFADVIGGRRLFHGARKTLEYLDIPTDGDRQKGLVISFHRQFRKRDFLPYLVGEVPFPRFEVAIYERTDLPGRWHLKITPHDGESLQTGRAAGAEEAVEVVTAEALATHPALLPVAGQIASDAAAAVILGKKVLVYRSRAIADKVATVLEARSSELARVNFTPVDWIAGMRPPARSVILYDSRVEAKPVTVPETTVLINLATLPADPVEAFAVFIQQVLAAWTGLPVPGYQVLQLPDGRTAIFV